MSDFTISLAFSDGTVGVVDLGDLAGRGVFCLWDAPGGFQQAAVGAEGQLAWGEAVELCPDALYLRLTGAKPEDEFPLLGNRVGHA